MDDDLTKQAHGHGIDISNEEFLRAVFGDDLQLAHVTAFSESPDKLDPNDREQSARCWAGGWYSQKKRSLKPELNTYFTISIFEPFADDSGCKRAKRRKSLHRVTCCIVVDDVGTKVPRDVVTLAPSWQLETSPGNCQVGYILAGGGETDRMRVEGLVNAMVAKGLAVEGNDPGMKGVTRYVRLPQGSNLKSAYIKQFGPSGWRCCLTEWKPERTYTIADLAKAFGITEGDVDRYADRDEFKQARPGAAPGSDPVLTAFAAIGAYKHPLSDGWHDVTCVKLHEHTDCADNGAAVRVNDDGSYGYRCHHKHGGELKFPKVVEWFDAEHPELGLGAKLWALSVASPDEFQDEPAEALRKRDYILGMIEMAEEEGITPDELAEMVKAQLSGLKNAQAMVEDVLQRLASKTGSTTEKVADKLEVETVGRPRAYDYDITHLKAIEYVVDGLLANGLVVIAGMSGVGKTSLLVPLAAIAAHLFDSPLRPVLRRKVVYVTESPRQVETVLYGLAKHAPGVRAAEFREWFRVIQSRRMQPKDLAALVRRVVQENTILFNSYPVAPLLVLDTSNATIELDNENDNSEVGRAIAAIKENLGTAGCWLIQHIAKSLKRADVTEMTARGAGAFAGDAEATAFIFEEPEIPGKRFLWLDKRRYEADIREVEFTTETHTETVATPWQTSQQISYRVGFPVASSSIARKSQVEEAKVQRTERHLDEIEMKVRAYLVEHGSGTKRQIWKVGVRGEDRPAYAAMDRMVKDGLLMPTGDRKGGADVYKLGPDPDFEDVTTMPGYRQESTAR